MLGILIGLYSQTGGLIAAGFGFVFWIIDLFSSFGDFSQNLKYFTPFYYFDVKYVIQETSLDVRQLAPLIAVIIILYVTSIWKFYNTDARG
jgi:hypothetical protein